MDKKAQGVTVGGIIMLAMALIVGAIFLQASAQNVGEVVNTVDVANASISSVNGTTLANLVQLNGKYVTDVVVYNSTDDIIITSGNYTIYQNQIVNGVETALINVTTQPLYQGQNWNVSYTYQPTTYENSSGGRAIAALIIVLMGLALIAVTIVYVIKGYQQ